MLVKTSHGYFFYFINHSRVFILPIQYKLYIAKYYKKSNVFILLSCTHLTKILKIISFEVSTDSKCIKFKCTTSVYYIVSNSME